MTQIRIAAAIYLMMAFRHKQLGTLTEARVVTEEFRIQCNTQRRIVSLVIGVRRTMWFSSHDPHLGSTTASLHRRAEDRDLCCNLRLKLRLTLRAARKDEFCQQDAVEFAYFYCNHKLVLISIWKGLILLGDG